MRDDLIESFASYLVANPELTSLVDTLILMGANSVTIHELMELPYSLKVIRQHTNKRRKRLGAPSRTTARSLSTLLRRHSYEAAVLLALAQRYGVRVVHPDEPPISIVQGMLDAYQQYLWMYKYTAADAPLSFIDLVLFLRGIADRSIEVASCNECGGGYLFQAVEASAKRMRCSHCAMMRVRALPRSAPIAATVAHAYQGKRVRSRA